MSKCVGALMSTKKFDKLVELMGEEDANLKTLVKGSSVTVIAHYDEKLVNALNHINVSWRFISERQAV